MKRDLLTAVLILMALGVNGCIVIEWERRESNPPPVAEPDDVTMREIDAVGKLAFDNDRHSGFKNIAARSGLGDGAQVHLVEAVFIRLAFDNAKVDVLLTLVHNPCFSSAAKAALLERLDRLAFENHKRQILDALSERA